MLKHCVWMGACVVLLSPNGQASEFSKIEGIWQSLIPESQQTQCADFSGSWSGMCQVDGQVGQPSYVTIVQSGCNHIKIEELGEPSFDVYFGRTDVQTVAHATNIYTRTSNADWIMAGAEAIIRNAITSRASENAPVFFRGEQRIRGGLDTLKVETRLITHDPNQMEMISHSFCDYFPQPPVAPN